MHGMHGGSWYLRSWLYAAAQAGWDAWAVNLRGHHGSRPVRDLGAVSVLDYVEDVEDCLRELREAVVIGHSMGGLVAQKVAGGGRVRAAVLATSAPPKGIRAVTWPVLWRMPRYAGSIVAARPFRIGPEDAAALLGNRLAPNIQAWAYAQLVPESGRAARELALGSIAVDPASVRCPTLVLGAEMDRITPAPVQRKIAARYNSEYLEAAGHAHLPMLEPGGERLFANVLSWLARVV
ncbi:MAG TPA: alpha/beta fold hydrolase [Candidatus Bathyarchaeia archaeon]|nr:alpha/beta fold hydrolase [Candidatus Bathyarchaeia archaeon]